MGFKKTGQFDVEFESIAKLLQRYSISEFTFERINNGIENTSIIIATALRKYVLRVYRYDHKENSEILREIGFMHRLRQEGLPIPKIYENISGELLTVANIDGVSWQSLLMDFSDGHQGHRYTPSIVRELATFQALMHKEGIAFATELPPVQTLTKLVENEFTHLINKEEVSDNRTLQLISRAEDYTVELSDELPSGYCHFDYDIENVLVDKEEKHVLAILDFDDMKYAPLVVCLAYSLWSVLIETGSFRDVEKYIEVYETERPLTRKEKNTIQSVMLFRHYVLSALTLLRGELKGEHLNLYISLEEKIKNYKFK